MSAKIVLVWIFITAIGCNSSNQKLPEGILSEEKMVEVITDIQLVEAAHKSIPKNANEQKLMRDTSYVIVFNKHHTTAVEFDSSLRVYTKYPTIFGDIMEQVSENLNKME